MSYVICPDCGEYFENAIPPILPMAPGWCGCPRPLPIPGSMADSVFFGGTTCRIVEGEK